MERFTKIWESFVNSSVIPLSHVVGEQHMPAMNRGHAFIS